MEIGCKLHISLEMFSNQVKKNGKRTGEIHFNNIYFFNPDISNAISTCNQYKKISNDIFYVLFFLVHLKNPFSRAQWPHRAGGCRVGQLAQEVHTVCSSECYLRKKCACS